MNNKENFKTMFKYFISAGLSFFVDIFLFVFIEFLLLFIMDDNAKIIVLSTIFARALSSLFNYYLNSRHVFKKYDKYSIIKYYMLVIVQMIVSATGVYLLNTILRDTYDFILKIFVDGIIFLVNYFVQRRFVF